MREEKGRNGDEEWQGKKLYILREIFQVTKVKQIVIILNSILAANKLQPS